MSYPYNKRETRADNYELVEVRGDPGSGRSFDSAARKYVNELLPGCTVTDVWLWGRADSGNHVLCVEYDLPDDYVLPWEVNDEHENAGA